MGQSVYEAAFKRESVEKMERGVSATEASEKLKVHVKTLYRWRDEYRREKGGAFPGKGNLAPADAEMRRLERENRDLREENEILKKAAAIFAKPPR